MVGRAFARVYPDLAEYYERALGKRWIESEKRPGKRPGAFCTGSGLTGEQRVYMTFGGALRDASTLAHETGHAWHGWLMRDLRPMARSYPMTLAETASVFAEQILAEGVAEDPGLAGHAEAAHARRRALRRGDHAAGHHGALRVRAGLPRRARRGRGRRHAPRRADGGRAAPRLGRRPAARRRPTRGSGPASCTSTSQGRPSTTFPTPLASCWPWPWCACSGAKAPRSCADYERFLRLTGSGSAEEVVQQALGEDIRSPEFWASGIRALEEPLARYEALLARGPPLERSTPQSWRRRPRRWRGTRRPRAAGGERCRRAGIRPGSPAPAPARR